MIFPAGPKVCSQDDLCAATDDALEVPKFWAKKYNLRRENDTKKIKVDSLFRILQILEVVRKNYDSLILKLQEGLESYDRYSERDHRPLLSRLVLAARQRSDNSAVHHHTAAALEHYTSISWKY